MFYDKNQSDTMVFSADLNMTFGEYLNTCKKPLYTMGGSKNFVPNSIGKMLGFKYTFINSVSSSGYKFDSYEYSDARFTASFVELS